MAHMDTELASRLPPLEGGWELETFGSHGGAPLRLFVPRAPDALLDDAEVQERNRFNDAMPYWAWVWDAAPVMVGQLAAALRDPGRGRPLRVLELGAGLGLVGLGLGCALGEGVRVTLTDHDPTAVRAMAVQIEVNGLGRSTTAEELDWNAPWPDDRERHDVVIASDVLYEARSHEPILGLLGRCLAPGGTAWFADPGRARSPGFLRRAEARGFRAISLDQHGEPAEPEIGSYRLYRLG